MRLEFIGAFESTYMPRHDVDVLETSGHLERWREDLLLLRDCGVRRLRYPVRWHRVEAEAGSYDWSLTDQVLGFMADEGLEPIVDLVHHTSYPRWLEGGLGDPGFGAAYLRYCEAFARRYGSVSEYTLFNEPFATLFLAGHQGIWPPYGRGIEQFVALVRNVLPALAEACGMYRDLLPEARHVYVDTCEGHSAMEPAAETYAALANDRRFFALDALLGRLEGEHRPFVREVVAAGAEDLLEMAPGHVDVLGLDYYAHSEWSFVADPGYAPAVPAGHEVHGEAGAVRGITPSAQPVGLAALALEYWQRYGTPMILSETNLRGAPSDRATWLKHTLDQCEQAAAGGARLDGYCWFPFLDSLDWNSLLARADRCIDPVGVFWLDAELGRNESTMSASFRRAAAGAPASQLPAYRLTDRTANWVSQLLPQMEGYRWQEAPAAEAAIGDPHIVRARAARGTAEVAA